MKKISLIVFILTCSFGLQAQVKYNSSGKQGNAYYSRNENKGGWDLSKVFVGSNLDLSLGYQYFMIGLNPHIGYRFNDYFSAGLSARFMYFSQRDYYLLYDASGNIEYKPYRYKFYGPGVFGRVHFLQNYFIHAEYEYNFVNTTGYLQLTNTTYTKVSDLYGVSSLVVGAGYFSQLSPRISAYAMILYDVLQNTSNNVKVDPNTMQRYSISPYADQLLYRVGLAVNLQ